MYAVPARSSRMLPGLTSRWTHARGLQRVQAIGHLRADPHGHREIEPAVFGELPIERYPLDHPRRQVGNPVLLTRVAHRDHVRIAHGLSDPAA
jgi:hypothetical protein